MSIKTELNRIKGKVGIIRDKFVSLGLAKSTDNLDALATAANGITKITAVPPTVTAEADDEEGEIYISALTELPKGYTDGGESGVVGKYIKLKIEGDTAIMYEGGNPSQEVRRKVGASINTCNITINIVDNVGILGVTATQFANGTVTTFRENKSSGTFTIPNVVCNSIITIVCNGWFSIGAWTNASQVGLSSLALIAPNTTGDYSANIIAYDD